MGVEVGVERGAGVECVGWRWGDDVSICVQQAPPPHIQTFPPKGLIQGEFYTRGNQKAR